MEFDTIDIHGMTAADAKRKLEQFIKTAPRNCEVTIIHGCHGGKVLQNMVRKTLKHKRIKKKILSLNDGETILVIE